MYSTKGFSYMECFKVGDLSRKIGKSEKTILGWHKDGRLPAIDERRQPFLFRGYDVIQCLKKLNGRNKQPKLALHEFYCRRCKEPQIPKGKDIAFIGAMAVGICPICGAKISKPFSVAQIPDVKKFFTLRDKASIYDSDISPLDFQILPAPESPKNGKEQLCLKF
jgi:hypothetical protein